MSLRVEVEVFSDPVDVAYHGHEGVVRTTGVEWASAVQLSVVAQQLRALATSLTQEAQSRHRVEQEARRDRS